jgi:hypothetical protein
MNVREWMDDEPDYRRLSQSNPTARKHHMCDACKEPILKGTKYIRNVHLIDGIFECYKAHWTCPRLDL